MNRLSDSAVTAALPSHATRQGTGLRLAFAALLVPMLCLAAGCERSQPGPKPISGTHASAPAAPQPAGR